jgi:hypothetical protein
MLTKEWRFIFLHRGPWSRASPPSHLGDGTAKPDVNLAAFRHAKLTRLGRERGAQQGSRTDVLRVPCRQATAVAPGRAAALRC